MGLSLLAIPHVVGLALIALVGYLVGRRHSVETNSNTERSRRELARAQAVAAQLDQIAATIRRELSRHQSSVQRFKDRIGTIDSELNDSDWKQLWLEAEQVLHPTMQLATRISHAYDELRQQTNMLMALSEVRTDALTNVRNRRAIEESLEMMFGMRLRYQQPFSIVLFDVDLFKQINDQHGHLHGDQVLREVAQVIDDQARESDIVGRFGGEEFIAILPQTRIDEAIVLAERVRRAIEALRINGTTSVTISCGVAEAQDNDDDHTLLSRADAALYHAKQCGRNQTAMHDADQVSPVSAETEDSEPASLAS
ncbi:MAG: GGDEF domain-containing protein [Pirellulales bacterium]|nr:GGDEF domain-containing protein [Pirellulales bacterium]